MKKILVLLYACTSLVTFAFAEETIIEGLWRDLASPVTTQARTVLIAGSTTTFAVWGTRSSIENPIQDPVFEHKPLGSSSKVGDRMGQMIPNALYATGMLTHYFITHSELSKDHSILMIKSSLYSSLLTTVLKFSVFENRPDGGIHSFPSGHATTAFAFAATVGELHEWYWGVAGYSLAAFVGFSRVNDRRHHIHDVLAGATVGMMYGLGTYYRSVDREKSENLEKQTQVAPLIFENGLGLALSQRF